MLGERESSIFNVKIFQAEKAKAYSTSVDVKSISDHYAEKTWNRHCACSDNCGYSSLISMNHPRVFPVLGHFAVDKQRKGKRRVQAQGGVMCLTFETCLFCRMWVPAPLLESQT